ncbi:MAG: Stp1/IreP family PP2C-type Ser/Thr phosphatase [Acidobacteriota bacterium]
MSNGIISTTIVGLTDPGLVRANNEDMLLVAEPETGLILENNYRLVQSFHRHNILLVVSDGMGGHEGGEVASHLTVDTIKMELARLPKQLSPQSRLEAAIEEANRIVWQQRQADTNLNKMGATATVVLVEQDNAYIAEVGDSRAYILRDGRIKQLTTDQTMVQMLIDAGAISPEAAAHSLNRNILLQAIGTHEFLQIAVTAIQLQVNDIFLLCSDGLSSKLPASDMKQIVVESSNLETAANNLVQTAKERGGEDNITVILAKFEGNGLPAKQRIETLTKQIQILARFDPEQEAQAKPKREVRAATFQDWLSSAVIGAFARSEQQRTALETLGEYGECIVFRKGDVLISRNDLADKEHYWLIDGRYRVVVDGDDGEKQTIAFIVSPTDHRSDQDIQEGLSLVRVKRQFFTANFGRGDQYSSKSVIWCEDDLNTAIRIPAYLFPKLAEILGERYINTVRHS